MYTYPESLSPLKSILDATGVVPMPHNNGEEFQKFPL